MSTSVPNTLEQRELMAEDGENLALRSFLAHLSEQPLYEALRSGLVFSGYARAIPDWAENEVGYVPKHLLQRWIRFIISLETPTEEQENVEA